MKNNKKIIIFTSALMMTVGIGIGSNLDNIVNENYTVISADDAVFEGFKYIADGDEKNEITITGYTSDLDLTNVVIPDEIDGKPVTKIGAGAFKSSGIISLTVSDSVTTIADYAFAYCYSLKELNLGKNVTSIGDGIIASEAYKTTMYIKKLTLSDNIKAIGKNIYGSNDSYYTRVGSLNVPASVSSINSTFYNRSSLTAINVEEGSKNFSSDQGILYNADKTKLIKCPVSSDITLYNIADTVTSIENSAFAYSSLTTINVPDSTTAIGNYAFAYCYSLKELDLGKNVTSIGDGVIATEAYKTAMYIEKLTLPDNLKAIGKNIYGSNDSYYTRVGSLNVPASVSSINSTFYNRSSLTAINVEEGSKNFSSDQGILYNADKTKLIKCPVSSDITLYNIADTVTSIENSAFAYSSLTAINVPDSTTTIGNYAFAYCYSLKELNLGKNVTSVGDGVIATEAYKTAMYIEKLTLPDNIKVIGNNIYGSNDSYYTRVGSLNIPASVSSINSTFYNRSSLTAINVEEGNKNYSSDQGILYNADKTKLLKCPVSSVVKIYDIADTVTSIENSAFAYSSLTTINVPDSTTQIGNYAFAYCNSLEELNLGKNVTSIGDGVIASAAYQTTMYISKLTLPDNLKAIGKNIYGSNDSYYTRIGSLNIPASVSSINSTFYNKSSLTAINVAEGNKSYSSNMGILYNGDKTTLIKCPQSSNVLIFEVDKNTKSINASAFANTKIQNILIPQSVTEIGTGAFSNSSLKTIEGYTGSYAETFANENKYTFTAIEESGDTPTDPDTPVTPPSTEGKLNYDVDGSGSINVMDLLKLKKYLLG